MEYKFEQLEFEDPPILEYREVLEKLGNKNPDQEKKILKINKILIQKKNYEIKKKWIQMIMLILKKIIKNGKNLEFTLINLYNYDKNWLYFYLLL